MWLRHPEKPTRYNGVLFRSGLEAQIASALDTLGVIWQYELPAHEGLCLVQRAGDPTPPLVDWYLPDFTVLDADASLQLPLWVEAKPAEALYAIRDMAGIPEYFMGNQYLSWDATTLHQRGCLELWKPKRCAEVLHESVLVVSALYRVRTLSILMGMESLALSRQHPAVNYRAVLNEEARQEREAKWRQAEAERQQTYHRQQQQRIQNIISVAQRHGRPARYDGWCCLCSRQTAADELQIFRTQYNRWAGVCLTCLAS